MNIVLVQLEDKSWAEKSTDGVAMLPWGCDTLEGTLAGLRAFTPGEMHVVSVQAIGLCSFQIVITGIDSQ